MSRGFEQLDGNAGVQRCKHLDVGRARLIMDEAMRLCWTATRSAYSRKVLRGEENWSGWPTKQSGHYAACRAVAADCLEQAAQRRHRHAVKTYVGRNRELRMALVCDDCSEQLAAGGSNGR